MLEKCCQCWLIWYLLFFCHGGAEGQLQWVVKEKVTSYGQNLILLCPVENCCSEPAGWNVGLKAIILDVKTFSNDPKVKYHGTYNKDGFGVVIRNLSEADLNVTYRCVYGFDQSIPKYLLHDDVFRESQLQWVVKEKVTGYGQNLIMLCPVENCCSEPAGWFVGPKWIMLDVKTFSNDPKVKYHGTYNKDGFGVVIRNLSEADLNVTYRCVYGFDQSTPKYLLHDDVFREKVPDKDKEIDTTAFGVPILVIMGVGFSIGIMAYCVYKLRNKKKRQKQKGTDKEREPLYLLDIQIENQQGTDKAKEALYRSDIQIENQQDKTNSLSKEENNFFRLYLLCQKIATQAVRQFFDSKVPGHTLEAFLKQHKPYLTSHRSVDRFTKDQEANLFPGGQAVDVSTDFDFSLLYRLIRHLLTAIPSPTCGWGNPPSLGHVNETDDIEIIRKYRNILAHNTKLAICDTDFSTHWTDLSQAIAKLSKGGLSTDVESMRTKTFDKCIKNEMEEYIRNELKEMREEVTDKRQDVAKSKTDIADNRQVIADNRQDIADNKQNTADNRQAIADNKQNIADNRQDLADNRLEIHNINTRHTLLNIQTNEALDDPEKKNDELKDMKSCGHVFIGGIIECPYHKLKNQARLTAVQDELKITKEMEDIIYVRAPISYPINREIRTGHSKGLHRLRRGHFKITPLAYRMATLFISELGGAWLRWSEGYNKYTNFTFRKTIVDDKTYFHIFSADYQDYYVKMGLFSWWVGCEKGDPEGCNDATWEIKCFEYNNNHCYVLCTKDSNDNYLSAGSTYRMHGRRGDINERRMFFIH